MLNPELAHERTLLGAVESFLGELVHVRPWLAEEYRDACEEMVQWWMESDGGNEIGAVTSEWVQAWLADQAMSPASPAALQDLFAWAVARGLIESNPLPALFD